MGDRWAGQPAADVSLNHALSLDVCNTQNETRDTTHGGAPLKSHAPVYRKRPFTTHADRRRQRMALLHEYPVGVGSRVVGRLWS